MISLGGRTGLCLGLAFWLSVNCAFPSAGSGPLLLGEWSTELPCKKEDIAAALTKWMKALTALRRYDSSKKCWIAAGNDLFVPAHGDRLATVYISGALPWKNALYTNSRLAGTGVQCCTMAHLVLSPEEGDQLVQWLTGNAVAVPTLKDVAPNLLNKFKACSGGEQVSPEELKTLLRKYEEALRLYLQTSGASLSDAQLNSIAFKDDGTLKESLNDYTHQILNELTHTERMLIYHYEGALPNNLRIYSRYSMCKSCEPAVVRAAGNNQVWFVSRCLYEESYIVGKTNAPVKKAVVYSDGNPVSIKDLWTYRPELHAYNISIDTFGENTWQAEH